MFAHPATAQTTPTSEQCSQAWANAVEANTLASYDGFLQQFALCAEADLAVLAISAGWGEDAASRADRGREPAPVVYGAVGQLAVRGESFSSVAGGYGLVLLSRGTSTRNRIACSIFTGALTFSNDPAETSMVDDHVLVYRPVYWPTQDYIENPSGRDCNQMILAYDHDRADLLLRRLPQGQGEGPFLIMMREDGRQAGVFDFSNLPLDTFERQFVLFLQRLSQEPDMWGQSFYEQATLRDRIRRFLIEDNAATSVVIASLFSFPSVAEAAEPR